MILAYQNAAPPLGFKERKAWFAAKREEARQLAATGMARGDVALALNVGLSLVNEACRGVVETRHARAHKRVFNDWLPADDEANVNQYWVPTPEEIAEAARAIREGHVTIATAHTERDRKERKALNRA